MHGQVHFLFGTVRRAPDLLFLGSNDKTVPMREKTANDYASPNYWWFKKNKKNKQLFRHKKGITSTPRTSCYVHTINSNSKLKHLQAFFPPFLKKKKTKKKLVHINTWVQPSFVIKKISLRGPILFRVKCKMVTQYCNIEYISWYLHGFPVTSGALERQVWEGWVNLDLILGLQLVTAFSLLIKFIVL